MTNVIKHRAAKSVAVVRPWSSREVVMIVEDDRGEFELAGLNLGLVNMPERAALVGGLLEVESQLGEGTTPVCSPDPR